MDEGYYYLKKSFYFDNNLLYDEIKIKQIGYAKILIEKFISNLKKKKLTLKRQKGKPTSLVLNSRFLKYIHNYF